MSPKKPKSTPTSTTAPSTAPPSQPPPQHHLDTPAQRNLNVTHGRNALAAYTTSPESFPPSRVISSSPDFVVIHDLYPKSSIHLLLLPRSPAKQLLHPFIALNGSDPAFLASVREEVSKLKLLAASELRRQFGRYSAQDTARREALQADPSPPEDHLPPGRDWHRDIVAGVHAHPSMNHLHIHILSVDRHSEAMRHRKHYNSFATDFFVKAEDLPLQEGDPRWHPGRAGYLEGELVCWRCGRGFGRGFKRLKEHLEGEFVGWRAE